MILGRFLGVLVALLLMLPISDTLLKHSWLIGFGEVVVLAILGTILGMGASLLIGPMVKSGPTPFPQDQLTYWTEKYGDDEGRDAYKIWLEEV